MFMKKVFYAYLLLAGIFLFACEKSEPVLYTGENFVHFEDTLMSISESSAKEDANGELQQVPSIATIRINRATTDISKELVVSFSVKAKYVATDTVTGSPTQGQEIEIGDVPEGNFFLSSPSAVTIKAGEAFAFVTLTAVDNDITDGDKKITFTIESASDASFTLGYPGPAKKAKSMDLYISDDDCPYDEALFLGNVKITDSDGFGTGEPTYETTIVASAPNVLEIKDFFKYSRIDPTFPQVSAFLTLVPATGSCLFLDQPFTGPGLNSTLRLVSDAPGKINTCTGTFSVPFRIYISGIPNINILSDVAFVEK